MSPRRECVAPRLTRLVPVLLLCLGMGCRDWGSLSRNFHGADAGECWGGHIAKCPADLEVCTSFEEGTLPAGWETVGPDPGLAIDSSCPNRGVYSASLTAPAVPSAMATRAQLKTDLVDELNLNHHVRAFFFVPAALPGPAVLIDLMQDVVPNIGVRALVRDGMLAIKAFGEEEATNGLPLPVGRWTCVELFVEISDDAQIRLWVDGVEAALARGDTNVDPKLGRVAIGLMLYEAPAAHPATVILIDDLAVDDVRIGCQT